MEYITDTLGGVLEAYVARQPDREFMVYPDRNLRFTYAEFDRAVAGLSRQLRAAGAKQGERVILLMPNSIEMDVALMAVMAAGAQVAPINPFLTAHEFEKQLVEIWEACRDADAVLCWPWTRIGPSLAEALRVPVFIASMMSLWSPRMSSGPDTERVTMLNTIGNRTPDCTGSCS